MRVAGRIAAQALDAVHEAVAPGVGTDALDRVGHEFLLDHHAYPSTLGYKGFPKSVCTCVNEVICHGIPDSCGLEDGDIVNVDITAYLTSTASRARRHRPHLPGRRRRRAVRGCCSSAPTRR